MADQTFEPADFSNVSSGTRSLFTSATRVGSAMARALVKIPGVAAQQALDILTVENLWTTALILAAWLFATVIGGPVGLVVNGILIALALYQLPQLAAELGALLKDGIMGAVSAKTEADLDLAADSIAQALSAAGLEILQVFVTHRLFVFAKPKLVNRFRVPPRIQQEHQRASSKVKERLKAAGERLKPAGELAAAAGVKPAAEALPTAATIAIGAVVLVGVTATIVAVAKGDGK